MPLPRRARSFRSQRTAVIVSIFHVNINVTDFERSLAFYQKLGFRVVRDLGEGGSAAMGTGLGMPGA
ncbi:VOC family protein, partial [Klebsiella pneumoniae]